VVRLRHRLLTQRILLNEAKSAGKNGGGGIRTLVGGISPETVFETAAFNRSATPPGSASRLDHLSLRPLAREASLGPPSGIPR
jgi:hypothetical protein